MLILSKLQMLKPLRRGSECWDRQFSASSSVPDQSALKGVVWSGSALFNNPLRHLDVLLHATCSFLGVVADFFSIPQCFSVLRYPNRFSNLFCKNVSHKNQLQIKFIACRVKRSPIRIITSKFGKNDYTCSKSTARPSP